MTKEKTIRSRGDLERVLEHVTFAPSCVNLDWQWDVREIGAWENYHRAIGWHVRTSFVRPDTDTGEVTRGYGRWEFVALGATESAVVKTCWVLAKMIVEHELMEAFHYKGAKIFNPHHPVDLLADTARSFNIMKRNGDA